MPEKPEYSFLAEYLVGAYHWIVRARRYEQGTPLPLSLHDVAAFADNETLPVSRKVLAMAVFAIDNALLEKTAKTRK